MTIATTTSQLQDAQERAIENYRMVTQLPLDARRDLFENALQLAFDLTNQSLEARLADRTLQVGDEIETVDGPMMVGEINFYTTHDRIGSVVLTRDGGRADRYGWHEGEDGDGYDWVYYEALTYQGGRLTSRSHGHVDKTSRKVTQVG